MPYIWIIKPSTLNSWILRRAL